MSRVRWLAFLSALSVLGWTGQAQAQFSSDRPPQIPLPINPALPDGPIPPAHEARPATSVVSGERAESFSSPITLYPGRASVIDFSVTGEVITYVQLSDVSRITYNTNAPIQSGAARVIVLRPIQTLFIDGITRAAVPNMVVTTIDQAGTPRTYLFDIYSDYGRPEQSETNGIAIAPAQEVRQTRLLNTIAVRPNVMRTELGSATLDDIDRGLEIAIQEGYTPPTDPVVFQVREAIARARNGTPLRTAARNLELDFAVLTTLGEIGVEARMIPSVTPESESTKQTEQTEPLVPPIYDIDI